MKIICSVKEEGNKKCNASSVSLSHWYFDLSYLFLSQFLLFLGL